MEIKRAGSQASTKGSSDYFSGTVRVDPLFQAPLPSASPARRSRSNRVPERRGTHTRSGKHSS